MAERRDERQLALHHQANTFRLTQRTPHNHGRFRGQVLHLHVDDDAAQNRDGDSLSQTSAAEGAMTRHRGREYPPSQS